MKKYPYVFLGFFISILVLLIIHFISINIKMNRVINVKEMDDSYSKKIVEIESDIEKLKDDECKNSLKYMSDRIKVTIPDKGVTLKDYYHRYYGYDNNRNDDDGETFLFFYSKVADNCNINNDSIYSKALESMVFPYEIKNRYLGTYQISISDLFILKDEIDKSDELGSYSNKMLELEVLSKLVEEVKK